MRVPKQPELSCRPALFHAAVFLGLVAVCCLLAPQASCEEENQQLELDAQKELQAVRSMLRRDSPRYLDARYRLERLLKISKLSDRDRMTALQDLARCQENLKLFGEAVETYRKLIGGFKTSSWQKAKWHEGLATVMVGGGKIMQARKPLEEGARLIENEFPVESVRLLVRSSRCLIDAGKAKDAILELQGLAHKHTDRLSRAASLVRETLADALRADGRNEEALKAYREYLSLSTLTTKNKAKARKGIVEILRSQNKHDEADSELLSLALMNPFNQQTARTTQLERVQLWMEAADYGRALNEAVILLYLSPPRNRPTAVAEICRALKAQDGHLARVQQYRNFITYGPAGEDGKIGTADDLSNPLERSKRTTGPQVNDGLLKDAIAGQATSPAELRAKGFIHLLAGQPQKAQDAFKYAFRVAGLADPGGAPLSQHIIEIAMADSAVRGHWKQEIAVRDWLHYGPNGKDAQFGSADDLKNPWLEK